MTTLAHDLELSETAEGTEPASEAAFLQEPGFYNARGFHFTRPMLGDHIVKLLIEGAWLLS